MTARVENPPETCRKCDTQHPFAVHRYWCWMGFMQQLLEQRPGLAEYIVTLSVDAPDRFDAFEERMHRDFHEWNACIRSVERWGIGAIEDLIVLRLQHALNAVDVEIVQHAAQSRQDGRDGVECEQAA